ncbi:MAG: serine hydrolase domain-containing protein [Saprospiraceae bacterium]
MKPIKLILLFLIGFCPSLFSQSYSLKDYLEKEGSQLPAGVELSIGIIENGQIKKTGLRKSESAWEIIQNDHALFEIGSITKTFTAALIFKLAEENKINIEDPIQQYLPVTLKNAYYQDSTIKIRHLLQHTSGLSNGPSSFTLPYLKALIFSPKNPNRNFKAKHYYKYLKDFELDYLPGKTWDYNNCGYGLLGTFIEKTSQKSWAEIVQKELFEPLKMNSSYFEINRTNKSNFVKGITAKGKKAKPWEMDFINPAGAIKSTLNDMLKYTEAALHPHTSGLDFMESMQNFPGDTIKMTESKLWKGNAMATGWWLNLEDANQPFFWHGGASGGYTAFIGFNQEKQKAVVILSNISSSHPQSRAENRIPIPIFLGQEMMRNKMDF